MFLPRAQTFPPRFIPFLSFHGLGVPLISKESSNRCIKYSYIVSKTHKSGRGETILSTFYISFATCTPFRPSLLKFPCLRWMNYKLFSSDHGILPVLRRERGRGGKRWGEFKETRERGMKEEKKKKVARNLYTCDPGVRQDSWIMWPSKRERGVRAPTLISIIVEYRMEFTRGPKCSPKYFIIEIVPRWAIKLERTSLRRKERGGSLERCVPSVSCTRTYTLLTWAPASTKSPRQR